MKRLIPLLAGIAIVLFTVVQLRATRANTTSTSASAPAGPAAVRISAEGRLVAYPGAEATLGSDISGTIETMNVIEKQRVRKGQTIAVIRAEDTRAALAQAKARVGEAEADIRLYESERDRAHALWSTSVGSKQAWERAERDVDSARARRASSVAEVRRLEAVIGKTIIKSPIDGVVITRFVHPGEALAAGDPIVTVADLTRTRVEAEVDEFDAARIRLGAAAVIRAEGYEGQWKGSVEEIPDSVTTKRMKPQDTSKPVDTRVLLVKVAMSEATPLKLAQRVEIEFPAAK